MTSESATASDDIDKSGTEQREEDQSEEDHVFIGRPVGVTDHVGGDEGEHDGGESSEDSETGQHPDPKHAERTDIGTSAWCTEDAPPP